VAVGSGREAMHGDGTPKQADTYTFTRSISTGERERGGEREHACSLRKVRAQYGVAWRRQVDSILPSRRPTSELAAAATGSSAARCSLMFAWSWGWWRDRGRRVRRASACYGSSLLFLSLPPTQHACMHRSVHPSIALPSTTNSVLQRYSTMRHTRRLARVSS
jgi:hypothetical protein